MKKLLALLLALLLIGSIALAEAVDFASMTDDDLNALIDSAKAEVERRDLTSNTENVTVFDAQGVTIVITSFEVDDDSWLYKPSLVAQLKAVNTSANDLSIYIDNVAINGWEVGNTGLVDIAAGHKEKDKFEFNLEDADVTTLDELETIEIKFHYQDPVNGGYLYTDPVTINF